MLGAIQTIGTHTGIFACPEGAATLAAALQLRATGWLHPEEKVVLFNTGTGLKYTHLWK
jgi:threonine synthase